MPLLGFRRHRTRYGEILAPRLFHANQQHLLVTDFGRRLMLNFKKILQSVRVESVGATDQVHFSNNISPRQIGAGAHGLIFMISPSEEIPFKERSRSSNVPTRTLVLKVYRKSIPKESMPGGFTQFVSQMAIYNYLKRMHRLTFVVRPVPFYFVSENLVVRNFIRAPTLEELKESLVERTRRRKPLSLALTDQEIDDFVAKNKVSKKFLDTLEHDILSALALGQHDNFNTKLPIVHDPTLKNFFILGRDASGKAIISIIDQGRVPIPGISEGLIKGQVIV